ncbi:bcl-2-binding component 3, isoforms 3/4-like [Melozone crissalis]|uniref:bcl-2-binding component 3, isoforms 3/4-like n=1 Tax=Melozone crissalis TaxID=40204 RepID=UPI0023DA0483|nr:bcl-2-binding component 3, isoforms 3/4-like [Melozone crissalis]
MWAAQARSPQSPAWGSACGAGGAGAAWAGPGPRPRFLRLFCSPERGGDTTGTQRGHSGDSDPRELRAGIAPSPKQLRRDSAAGPGRRRAGGGAGPGGRALGEPAAIPQRSRSDPSEIPQRSPRLAARPAPHGAAASPRLASLAVGAVCAQRRRRRRAGPDGTGLRGMRGAARPAAGPGGRPPNPAARGRAPGTARARLGGGRAAAP